MQLGKYELGRTLGEGNFGKVKFARHLDSGQAFAVKILDKKKILQLQIDDQIKREIGTLKLLKHPNVVRLQEVIASKSKIYMVLEYVTGGELFDRIEVKGRLGEAEGRKLFQQLIDAVTYCHDKGVFHRDLKPENVLVDAEGNIKISDFGLSALRRHYRDDGLLHTTCGSPNYVAPEVLANKGYDGATSDMWSCGVILYVMLTGCLPFDDRNLAVLYHKIYNGEFQIPKWLSSGAQNMIRRILDPNPKTRITVAEIKSDRWFRENYTPASPYDEDDKHLDEEPILLESVSMALKSDMYCKVLFGLYNILLRINCLPYCSSSKQTDNLVDAPAPINAFQLIGMSSFLDLSGFFEEEDASERKIMFTSNHSLKDLLENIEGTVTNMGFSIHKRNGKLKVIQHRKDPKTAVSLSVCAEVFELSSSLYVVELRKSGGDLLLYRQLCSKLINDLGICQSQILSTEA